MYGSKEQLCRNAVRIVEIRHAGLLVFVGTKVPELRGLRFWELGFSKCMQGQRCVLSAAINYGVRNTESR